MLHGFFAVLQEMIQTTLESITLIEQLVIEMNSHGKSIYKSSPTMPTHIVTVLACTVIHMCACVLCMCMFVYIYVLS